MYLLTEWEGRTGKYLARGQGVRAQRGPYVLTESQIFSRPARPYSVNKHFIIWPLTVENFQNSVWTWIGRDYIRSDGCPRGTITWISTTKICHLFLLFLFFYFFASNKKLTIHMKTQLMQFMLKSQQKVDIKLSKICQSIKNWASDKRSLHASLKLLWRLTKMSASFNSSYLSGYLSTSWILLNKGQPNFNDWILMTQMLAPANSSWVCGL